MQVSKTDIITRVRLLIDEVRMNEGDFDSGADERDLDTLIAEMVLEALRFVNLNAPHELLAADAKLTTGDEKHYKTESGIIAGTCIGVFSGVENFLRLVCVRCSAWSKPIYEFISEGTPSWEKLSNKYLTGTIEDPRVSIGKKATAIDVDSYDNAEIRLYCISESDTPTAEIYYMEQPTWLEEDKIRLSYLLQDAFFYYLTYLVLMALGDQRAQIALQQAYPLMGLKANTDD